MIARYRLVCALVNGDRVIDEWTRVPESDGLNTIRRREREEYRERMSSFLDGLYHRFVGAASESGDPATYAGLLALRDDDRRAAILARLLRYVATVEAGHLARDYVWFRGRRFPGMPIRETSLAVLRVWAPLHLLLVCDGEPPQTREGDRLLQRIGRDWPLRDLGPLEAELRTALERNPLARSGWQDNYNVAAAFAVLLLRRPRDGAVDRVAGDTTEAATRAVRYLERAVSSSSPGVLAEYEEWVSAGDQDLNGLRGTRQYVDFLERSFPGRERWERRPYDLLTYLMSTHLLTVLRDFALLRTRAARSDDDPSTWTADLGDVRLLRSYGTDHADWRTRLPLIRATGTRAAADPGAGVVHASFPRFAADPGLRSRVGGVSHRHETGVDAYYEELTSRRHAFWERLAVLFERLADATEVRTCSGAPPDRWRDEVVETWRAVHELCDAALRNDMSAAASWADALARRVECRVALLRGDPPGSGERSRGVTAA